MKESVKVEQKEEVKKHKPATKKELKKLCSDNCFNLGTIDTSLITDMSGLFQWSRRRYFSGIETWDTSNVTDMSNMFEYCEGFNHPLNFDTSKVTNMNSMFNGCKNFNQPLNFDTRNVTDMSGMFRGCNNFNQPLNFDISNVSSAGSIFESCDSLSADNVVKLGRDFHIKNSQEVSFMPELIKKNDWIKKVNGKYQPQNKDELKALVYSDGIGLDEIDTSLITDMSDLFIWSKRKDFSGINTWDTSKVTDMSRMFAGCENFNQPLNFDTSSVTNMYRMFWSCVNFNQALDFNTSNVINMNEMFQVCSSFNQALDFNTSNVINMNEMFSNCDNFNQPLNFDTSSVATMNKMFFRCKNFNQPLNFDTSNVTDMSYMFLECSNFNQPLNFDTSNVTDMSYMFYKCSSFNQALSFNTSNVYDMESMFEGCSSLEHKPDFDMGNVKNKKIMFKGCDNMKSSKKSNSSSKKAQKELEKSLEKIKDYLTDESNVIGVAVLNSNDVDESDLELDGDMEISDFVWDYSCVGGFELNDDSIELNDEEHIQLALYEKTYSSGEYVVGYTREKAYAGVYKVPEINNFNPDLLVGYAYSFPDELDIPANYILKGFVYLDEDTFKNYCKGIDEKVIKEVLDECNLKSLEGIDEKARAYIFMRLFEKTGIEPNSDIIYYTTEDIIDTSIQTVNI